LNRANIGVWALAAVALLSGLKVLLDVVEAYRGRSEIAGVSAFESRMEPVKALVRPHATVGYLTDTLPQETTTAAEYYLTQYALAPRIVLNTLDQRFIVANFHLPEQEPANLGVKGLELVRDFGAGVKLYRNAAK
jgi:hypothetical protein